MRVLVKRSLSRLRAWLPGRVRLPVLFGPIFFHEWHRTTRRGRHTFLRLLYTSLILTFLYLTYSEWTVRVPIHPRRFAGFAFACFTTFALAQLTAVFLLTPAYLATVITEEKEGKTLEFLLAADMGSREIVLGKFLARLGHLTLLILAGLPILCLLELSGGVAPPLAAALFATTGITLLSLASLSTFFSVQARKSLNAMLLTYLVIALYLAISGAALFVLAFPSIAGIHLTWGEDALTIGDAVQALNAGNLPTALSRLSNAWRSRSTGQLLLHLLRNYALFHGAVAVFCLGGAVFRLRTVARQQAVGAPRRSGQAPARPNVWRWPVLWKELFVEADLRFGRLARVGLFLFFLLALTPALVVLGTVFDRGLTGFLLSLDLRGIDTVLGAPTNRFHHWGNVRERMNLWVGVVGVVEICALLLIMLLRACGSFSGERARQTLDCLLTTPLSTASIVAGKAFGCLVPLRIGGWSLAAVIGLGYATRAFNMRFLGPLLVVSAVYAGFFIVLGLWLSAVLSTTTRASLAGLCAAVATAMAPGLPVVLAQLWYLNNENAFRELAPTFDLVNLFSPPEMLRFLFFQGPNSLRTRFADRVLVPVCCGHLAIYVAMTVLFWRSLCRRLRVEIKADELTTASVHELPVLTAKETLA